MISNMSYQTKILFRIPTKTYSRVLLVLVLSCTSLSNATTFSEKSLGDLLAESDGIVLGTVRQLKCLYDRNKQIQTFVTLTDLRVIHGFYGAANLVFQLRGGKIDGEIQDIEGSPKFVINERVLLFIKGNGAELIPFVGWAHGVFRVFHDEKTGSDQIKDHDGNLVVGIADDELIKEQTLPTAKEGSAGKTDDGSQSESVASRPNSKPNGITLSDFLNAMSRKLKEKGLRGKSLKSVNIEAVLSNPKGSLSKDAAPPPDNV